MSNTIVLLLLMIIKKILSFAASIINFFIFLIILTFNSNAQENNVRYFFNDEGVFIIFHRFNEFKYPSTNISMDIFKEHVDLILDANLTFTIKDFVDNFDIPKKKKILLTVDDAFQSFYDNAWPYLKIKLYLYYLSPPNLLVTMDT